MARPILVRLPNWVGDVIMALPALARLEQAGLTLDLVGRRWAGPLLAGQGWTTAVLPGGTSGRVRLLRDLRLSQREQAAAAVKVAASAPAPAPTLSPAPAMTPTPALTPAPAPAPVAARRGLKMTPRWRQPDALLLTNSFSSALEARLAGLRPLGYNQDGRRWLLTSAVEQPRPDIHESQRFDHLARALLERLGVPDPLGDTQPVPALALSAEACGQAETLLASHLGTPIPPFACLVPFATGTLKGVTKAWPGFPAYAAQLARRLPVVLVPGPDEVAVARRDFPAATILEGVDLGVYGAVLARAAVVVSNDTGPGHLAAAVGSPLISVLGPTDPVRYQPLGADVCLVQASPWPTTEAVEAAVDRTLQAPPATSPGPSA